MQQGSQIKSGASHNNRNASAGPDFFENFSSRDCVVTSSEDVGWFSDIDQAMRNPAPLRFRDLGRSDLKAPIDLDRIAIDDFPAQLVGKP